MRQSAREMSNGIVGEIFLQTIRGQSCVEMIHVKRALRCLK